jgi:hypothetical protein
MDHRVRPGGDEERECRGIVDLDVAESGTVGRERCGK